MRKISSASGSWAAGRFFMRREDVQVPPLALKCRGCAAQIFPHSFCFLFQTFLFLGRSNAPCMMDNLLFLQPLIEGAEHNARLFLCRFVSSPSADRLRECSLLTCKCPHNGLGSLPVSSIRRPRSGQGDNMPGRRNAALFPFVWKYDRISGKFG